LNILPQCINCIFNQAYKVTKELNLDNITAKKILEETGCEIKNMSFSKTPPQNALPVYTKISQILNTKDIYLEKKLASIKKAKDLIPFAKNLIENSDDKFLASTKIAVAGNVIDLASEFEFDLEEEIKGVLDKDFAADNTKELFEGLKNSNKVAYLADNAGENEFDKLYIKYLKKFFPQIEIFYFVRSKPIINDICYEDMKNDKELLKIANLVNSGILTPGVVLDDLSPDAREILEKCDIIISKGMGNYECLSDKKVKNLFYLLKVKCEVVAMSLNLKVGDLVCKKST